MEPKGNFLTLISIDKGAKHHRCSACGDVLLRMSGGHVLSMSVSLLCEIETERLPANFDPVLLPLRICRACRVENALSELIG